MRPPGSTPLCRGRCLRFSFSSIPRCGIRQLHPLQPLLLLLLLLLPLMLLSVLPFAVGSSTAAEPTGFSSHVRPLLASLADSVTSVQRHPTSPASSTSSDLPSSLSSSSSYSSLSSTPAVNLEVVVGPSMARHVEASASAAAAAAAASSLPLAAVASVEDPATAVRSAVAAVATGSRGLAELLSARWALSGRGAIGVAASGGTNVVAVCLFVSLLCACMVVAHLLEEVHWLNESVTAVVCGLISGAVVLVVSSGKSSHILRFDEDLFFIYLLPPIIFNAGFQVKKKQFFRNFGGIMLYGVIGVFISFAVIASGCWYFFPLVGMRVQDPVVYLALGVIFSATDSVCTLQVLDQDEQPLLYSLVFGEGVVNDATSVVLFHALRQLSTEGKGFVDKSMEVSIDFTYLFIASTALGITFGLLSAFLIKTLYFGRHSTDREIALMSLMAYLSYVISDVLGLSGILAVFFCGIVMSHYTWHNVTESSRVTTKHSFATMSYIAETFIFIYLGMDALDLAKWQHVNFRAAGLLFTLGLGLTLLGRAAFVFPLSLIINSQRKDSRTISLRQQVVIWWSGLMRGAVSIALAYRAVDEHFKGGGDASEEGQKQTAMVAVMAVVLFSTLVFGLLTRPIIDLLVPHTPGRNDSLARSDSLLTEHTAGSDTPKQWGWPSTEQLQVPLLQEQTRQQQQQQQEEEEEEKGHVQESKASTAAAVLEVGETEAESSVETGEGQVVEGVQVAEGDEFVRRSSWAERPDEAEAVLESTAARVLAPALLRCRKRDLHDWWRWFDDSYMRPHFGGRGFMPVLPPSPTVSMHNGGHFSIVRLSLQDVSSEQRRMREEERHQERAYAEEGHGEPRASSTRVAEGEEGVSGVVRRLELQGDALEGSRLAEEEEAWPAESAHHRHQVEKKEVT